MSFFIDNKVIYSLDLKSDTANTFTWIGLKEITQETHFVWWDGITEHETAWTNWQRGISPSGMLCLKVKFNFNIKFKLIKKMIAFIKPTLKCPV